MLQKIRDNTQGLLAKIFLGFVILIFSFFGLESLVGTFVNATPELTVNDAEISSAQIDSLAQRKAQEFLSQMGENADFSNFDETLFRQSAVDELIQRELLRQSAADSGMTASSAEIDRRILQTTDFQVDGQFNEERANVLLRSMGYTPESYRATLAEELLLNQLVAAYSATGFATDRELERMAQLVHQKRSFRQVTLALDTTNTDIDIADADVEAYYENNQDEFQREEQVRISWLELNRENLFDEIEVSEEQVRAAYDDEVAGYQAQTERRAAHILFQASSEEEFDAAREQAAMVRERIEAGEDFADLAAEFSDDQGSAEDGGDIGYTTGDSFEPAMEAALQEMDVGEVSEPVRTDFGIHLIKLLEENATEVASFEERREDLERDLKSREVETMFIARSEELGNLAFESVDLQEPADIMGLQRQESDWFGRSGGTGITARSAVINAAFSSETLDDGLNSELIRIDDNRTVVIHVLEHRPAAVRPLEEVRDEIVTTLRLQRMQEQARMIGETIIDSLRAGVNVDSLLEAQGVSWTEYDDVERVDTRINPEITEFAFSMNLTGDDGEPAVEGFTLNSGAYVVVHLQDVTPGSLEDLEEGEAAQMRTFISQQGAALDFAGFLRSLEERAEITGRLEAGELQDTTF